MEIKRRQVLSSSIGVFGSFPLLSGTGLGSVGNAGTKITEEKKNQYFKEVKRYKRAFPEEGEVARQASIKASLGICEACEKLDLDALESGSTITLAEIKQIQRIGNALDEAVGYNLPMATVDDVYANTRKASKFLPLLSATQEVIISACKLQEDPGNTNRLEDFHTSVLLMLAEVLLLETSIGYRVAWVGTRYAANIGLVRLRRYFGLRIYAMLLSVVHWIIRMGEANAKTYVLNESTEVVRSVMWNYWEDPAKYGFTVPDRNELDYDFYEEMGEENFGERDSNNTNSGDSNESTTNGEGTDGKSSDDDEDGWWPL